MIGVRDVGCVTLIFLLLVFWGCDLTSEPRPSSEISIIPEQNEHTLDPDGEVEFTVVNSSKHTLFLPVCGPDLTLS